MSDQPAILTELGFRFSATDLYQQTINSVLQAAQMLELPKHLQLILAQPKNELIVHFPVRRDDGSFTLFKGYRVQHNNILGPYKGGMRYHASVHLDDIKSLAVLMTMKCSLARLPLGGAKGGVQVDPRTMSSDEMMRLTRRFTAALGTNIGPDHDIPAPDVGTNAQTMAWMADTFINMSEPTRRWLGQAVVTGKPVDFGGSQGREAATGQGLVIVVEHLLPKMGLDVSKVNFSLIGYGNVGSWTARLLAEKGARLQAVMDHTGAIRHDKAIDAQALAGHVQTTGGVKGFPKADAISEDEFHRQPVDLFIPAALEQMVTLETAQKLRCKVLVEAANAPTTPEAERHLLANGVQVLPAILCNCGGVTVSYFEWKQNRQAETWSQQRVLHDLTEQMIGAAERVGQAAQQYGCDMRTAAYIASLQWIGQVYRLRGIFP